MPIVPEIVKGRVMLASGVAEMNLGGLSLSLAPPPRRDGGGLTAEIAPRAGGGPGRNAEEGA